MKKRHQQKLIILSVLLLFLFNIPVVLLFNKGIALMGLPILYIYIFLIWGISIIVSYLILKKYYE